MGEPLATFSPCRTYRFTLHRQLTPAGQRTLCGDVPARRGRICWIMLNPSTADETHNDPTVAKCCRLSTRWEFSSLVVVNIFALRSTDPKALYKHPEPIGHGNDAYILEAAKSADLVVCAWGQHGSLCVNNPWTPPYGRDMRGPYVRRMMEAAGIVPHALRVTTGEPHHPLYLPESLAPQPLESFR
jgi:hypothetical protein